VSVWMLLAGGALLALAVGDIVVTTISTATAGGPIATRLGRAGWRLAHLATRRPGSRLLASAGPIIMVTTIVVWLALLWAGWTLVFSADTSAVVDSMSREPADWSERAYFAGFTTFTLGTGDYVPVAAPWQLLSVVASISGLALATAAITYLVPVVTAATERDTQAAAIAGLGDGAHDIVRRAYHRGSTAFLEPILVGLVDSLLLTAERHLAYPILHYFHPRSPQVELRVQLPALDDALTLLEHGLDASVERPHPAALGGVRVAVAQLVERAPAVAAPAPPPLDLAPLRAAGVPVVDDATFARRLAALGEHRGRVASFAAESKWHFDVSR
jgi:hypothetical protein